MITHIALFLSIMIQIFSSSAMAFDAKDLEAKFKSDAAFSADFEDFAQSRAWSVLFFADLDGESLSTNPKFFVSPSHKVKDELQESLKRLLSEPVDGANERFYCQFPARAKRISARFSVQFPDLQKIAAALVNQQHCADLRRWQERVHGRSAAIVFSSYYLGNPSSTFGHTFLRISRYSQADAKANSNSELLDQGINFGADANTDNPVYYAVGGMIGVFQSSFIALPYYYKVREYNDYEARDLWEYKLNLTEAEAEDLSLVLWEQGKNSFAYYFLTKNCGYYVLALVEAVAPRYQITPRLRKWVIPADTIVVAQEEGLIQATSFRPSLRRQLQSRLGLLNQEQLKEFQRLKRELVLLEPRDFSEAEKMLAQLQAGRGLSAEEAAKVLDALLDDFDIENKSLYLEKSNEAASSKSMLKRAMLFQRSDLPTAKALQIQTPWDRDPSRSHPSVRWAVGYEKISPNSTDSYQALSLGFRTAFHDLLDPALGAPQSAEIEVFNGDATVFEKEKYLRLQLERFRFLEIHSVPFLSQNDWTSKSWRVGLGASRYNDFFAANDLRSELVTDVGFGPLALKLKAEASDKLSLFRAGPSFFWGGELASKWNFKFEVYSTPYNWKELKYQLLDWQELVDLSLKYHFTKDLSLNLSYKSSHYENTLQISTHLLSF